VCRGTFYMPEPPLEKPIDFSKMPDLMSGLCFLSKGGKVTERAKVY